MKKLALYLLFALSLTSCQKKYCWKCTMYQLNSQGIMDMTQPHVSTQCDMSQSDAKNYESKNTATVKVYNGNNYQTNTVKTTHCTQQ